MTTFTAPLKVKKMWEETTAAIVDTSGTATFTSLDGTLTLTGVTTTVAAQGTAVPIPASAEGFLEVNIGGSVFRLVYFSVS